MKFSVAAIVAFAAAVLAQPKLLNSAYNVQEGQPFTLLWGNAQGPVTITLMSGSDPNNLRKVQDVTTGQTGTTFTWTPSGLPSGTYAFRITDDSGQPNYSPSFLYQGTGTLSSPSPSPSPSNTGTSSSLSAPSTSASASGTPTDSSSISSSSPTPTPSFTSSNATASISFTTSASSVSTPSSTPSTKPSGSTTPPDTTSGQQRFASPLGFVLVTVAALILLS